MMPRADDFQIPYCNGKYFPDHSRVQAKEHRNMMQIMPHTLNGINQDCCELMCSFTELYMERHRKDRPAAIDENALIIMDQNLLAFDALFQRVVACRMPSGGDTIKYHKASHFTSMVRRLGAPKHFNAQFFEGDHHRTKIFYNGTSKRRHKEAFIAEMCKRDNTVNLAKDLDDYDVSIPQRTHRSAYLLAAGTGKHVFTLDGDMIGIGLLDQSYSENYFHPGQVRKSQILLQNQPEVPELPKLLGDFLGRRPSPLDLIKVHKSAALAGEVPFNVDALVLQVARACSAFHGEPWFDGVCVKGEGGLWYAQLRLMFSYDGMDLALVRWYNELPGDEDDILVRYGCKSVTWATRPGRANRNLPWYQVISMDTILRREYIVLDFKKMPQADGLEFFHVSAFKWNRMPTDRSPHVDP
ncbi:hypothetical protein DUNSADRAFT_15856 [Dunaliella salina]|uniref:Uncharacterized protein n=1 Tax=Dunaliella salina TaxID=3046 RepID=A0ABQ7G4S3_DUNSA|nr:hypothetical protein DUNSADRAFT_15856 [Dunaliella salina]|eukprot:KAF5829602.1 hypothetical protein DUNSADRAFT_15856 [Dunaliella salina]